MKPSPSVPQLADMQQLVALTAFLAQKCLLLAGAPFFENGTGIADLAAAAQKRSQIDRLCNEFDVQLAAHAARSPLEAQCVAALKALSDGLRDIGREAEALAGAAGAPRPDGETLRALHAAYEGSATLLAQAVGACVEQAKLNLRETVETLRGNALRLEEREAALPAAEAGVAAALPVRSIARHARRVAGEVSAFLAPLAPAPGGGAAATRATPGPLGN